MKKQQVRAFGHVLQGWRIRNAGKCGCCLRVVTGMELAQGAVPVCPRLAGKRR